MKRFLTVFLLFVLVIENVSALPFVKIKNGNKYGLINKQFKLVTETDYTDITFINSYVFLNSRNNIEIRNEKNQIVDKVNSDECGFFTSVNYLIDDYYVFHGFSKDLIYNVKSKASFYSKKIAANKFNEKTSYLQPVYTEGYYFSISDQNKYFSNSRYQKAYPFVDGVAIVLKDNWQKALIDENGNLIVDDIINCGWQFKNGLLPVITKEYSGFINLKGELVYKCPIVDEYKNENVGANPTLSCSFSDGYAYVHTKKDKWMLINKKFEIIKNDLPYFVNTRGDFSEEMLPVYLDSKCGYLNTKGELCIPLIFDEAEDFYNGYACVIYKGENGIVDKKGNLYLVKDILNGKKEIHMNVCIK